MAKLFAIDMDGTLTNSVCWTPEECLNAEPNQEMIDKVNSLRNVYIIINTARVDSIIPATIQWLRKHNVKYHGINNQKIPATYYVDDKNLTIDQFLKGEYDDKAVPVEEFLKDGFNKKRQVYIPGGY
jgi:uncharacterized HAD superfamily protein